MIVVPLVPAHAVVGLQKGHPARLLVRVQLQHRPGIPVRRSVIAPGPVIIKLRQADIGPHVPGIVSDHLLQERDAVVKGFRPDPALLPEHVFNPLKLRLIRELKQLVDGDAKEDGQVREQSDIRHARSRLPLGDRLGRHAQILRQFLLPGLFGHPQGSDSLSDIHIIPHAFP